MNLLYYNGTVSNVRIFNGAPGKRKIVIIAGSGATLLALLFFSSGGARVGTPSAALIAAAGGFFANLRDTAARTFFASPQFLAEIPLDRSASSAQGAAGEGVVHPTPTLPSQEGREHLPTPTLPSQEGRGHLPTPTPSKKGERYIRASPSSFHSTLVLPSEERDVAHATETIGTGILVITEICAGTDAGARDEFIELYNPGDAPIDLTGWTVKRRSGAGKEATLVAAARLKGKFIPPKKHFLIVNEGGYAGKTPPDAAWAKSSALTYAKNAIIVYNNDGSPVTDAAWDEIPKGQSIGRSAAGAPFALQAPEPENTNSR